MNGLLSIRMERGRERKVHGEVENVENLPTFLIMSHGPLAVGTFVGAIAGSDQDPSSGPGLSGNFVQNAQNLTVILQTF